jgi:hypothetical protein
VLPPSEISGPVPLSMGSSAVERVRRASATVLFAFTLLSALFAFALLSARPGLRCVGDVVLPLGSCPRQTIGFVAPTVAVGGRSHRFLVSWRRGACAASTGRGGGTSGPEPGSRQGRAADSALSTTATAPLGLGAGSQRWRKEKSRKRRQRRARGATVAELGVCDGNTVEINRTEF